jgi:3-hydroxy-3-methylglutaryl CoA synthase
MSDSDRAGVPRGIIAWGGYLPAFRLSRAAVAAVHGGAGKGSRAVAAYDEDTTTMGVEAARIALSTLDQIPGADVLFATTAPAYADKTNATAVHAALGLTADSAAYDLAGGLRSGAGVLRIAAGSSAPTLAVLSDLRIGLPGSPDERAHGDGAAAFLCGEGREVAAEYLGSGTTSGEFLDRWREPGSSRPQLWEERFALGQYRELAAQAWAAGLKSAGLTDDEVTMVAVVGTHGRSVTAVTKERAAAGRKVARDLTADVGMTGAAHVGLALAAMLDEAQPGDVIAVQSLADGSDVLFFRATAAILARRPQPSVVAQLPGREVAYTRYLTWRGMLEVEPPRRPEPDRPAAPPSQRNSPFKFGMAGSRCLVCGRVSLPPRRTCYACGAVDQFEPAPMARAHGVVANFTIDRLAFTPSPPMVAGLVDLDAGGRFQGEFTDVDGVDLTKGTRMEMTFRRLYTAGGIHNYFWKARPARSGS